jgi:hypothetical protein
MIVFTLPFVVLNMAARTLGSRSPDNPTLEGFTAGCEGQTEPCWYGIVPGVTTAAEARDILANQGFSVPGLVSDGLIKNNELFRHQGDASGCNVSLGAIGQSPYISVNRPFDLFSIDCTNLKLGNIVVFLGWPDFVELCGGRFRYQNGIGLVNFDALDSRLSLYNQHVRLFLGTRQEQVDTTEGSTWRGLAPCWRYAQMRG